MAGGWIFQTSSEAYEIEGHLNFQREWIVWIVKQHAKEIRGSDIVFLWRSVKRGRQQSFVFARGLTASEPKPLHEFPSVPDFWKKDHGAKLGVEIKKIEELAPNMITLSEIMEDKVLSNTEKVRKKQGTNFRLSEEERRRLDEIFNLRLNLPISDDTD